MDVNEEFTIEGIMDYIEIDEENNTALIIDWKTGFSGVYNHANKKSMLQAYIYPLMVFERYKFVKQIIFKYVFVVVGFAEIAVAHNRTEYNAKVEGVKEWIIRTYKALDFKAGEHCSNCKKISECKFVTAFMDKIQDKLDTEGPMIKDDKEYKDLGAYIKIAEKKMELYKDAMVDDPEYWTFRTNNNNELVTSALVDGKEAIKIVEALSKNGVIKLTKTQYESVLGLCPDRAVSSSFKSKVFKLKKQ